MLKSDIQGLSAHAIRIRYSLSYTPTMITDVEASGARATCGIAGANYGWSGGNVQIEFLDRVRFTNPQPLPYDGIGH